MFLLCKWYKSKYKQINNQIQKLTVDHFMFVEHKILNLKEGKNNIEKYLFLLFNNNNKKKIKRHIHACMHAQRVVDSWWSVQNWIVNNMCSSSTLRTLHSPGTGKYPQQQQQHHHHQHHHRSWLTVICWHYSLAMVYRLYSGHQQN